MSRRYLAFGAALLLASLLLPLAESWLASVASPAHPKSRLTSFVPAVIVSVLGIYAGTILVVAALLGWWHQRRRGP